MSSTQSFYVNVEILEVRACFTSAIDSGCFYNLYIKRNVVQIMSLHRASYEELATNQLVQKSWSMKELRVAFPKGFAKCFLGAVMIPH